MVLVIPLLSLCSCTLKMVLEAWSWTSDIDFITSLLDRSLAGIVGLAFSVFVGIILFF